jgi:tetratricopeptide (TPR) repeat protein
LGKDHFGTGRVLDTIGMIYASKDNFHAAQEFYRAAIACKKRFDDQAGLAVSCGNLGRLYLDWGYLDHAAHAFDQDLKLAQAILDGRGEAQVYNHLGQVELARGERAADGCRLADARRHWADAAGWLDSSIRQAEKNRWVVLEAYARKDRALLFLAEDQLPEAEDAARTAEERFRPRGFAEGIAHVNRVWGAVRRRQGSFDESQRALRAALAHFEETREQAEIARTRFEIARTRRAGGDPRPQVIKEYLHALAEPEACRRADLIRRIEEELKAVDAETHWAHVYRRIRGREVPEDTASLTSGTRETATVLYLDLKGSTDYALSRDPEEVMMALNQMMADLVAVLRRHDARVSAFRGTVSWPSRGGPITPGGPWRRLWTCSRSSTCSTSRATSWGCRSLPPASASPRARSSSATWAPTTRWTTPPSAPRRTSARAWRAWPSRACPASAGRPTS